jgi:hypothetical protein
MKLNFSPAQEGFLDKVAPVMDISQTPHWASEACSRTLGLWDFEALGWNEGYLRVTPKA